MLKNRTFYAESIVIAMGASVKEEAERKTGGTFAPPAADIGANQTAPGLPSMRNMFFL